MTKGGPMAKVGFVLLCHTALHRAAQVALHWADRGCPVVIHVDKRVGHAQFEALTQALGNRRNIIFSRRHACEWGTWGLIAATQEAARLMLDSFPSVRHVYLASGACLPLRPVEDLVTFLDERPHTDFIECVTTADVGWATGGLDIERFTLGFPFSWRKHRKLFDAYVTLQRRLGVQRHIPLGLVPHMGSQWWCLTRQTLSAILESPDRPVFDRFFRKVWIPDESYFQTLVRRFSTKLESRSLTLTKFDFQGKPHTFYDDHLELLQGSDCFVARKIWPHADRLYDHFLNVASVPGTARPAPNPGRIDRLFAKALEIRTKGRPGLYMQSRFPRENWENGRTAGPYSVFEGFDEVFEDFNDWLARTTGLQAHGHLYAREAVEFAAGAKGFYGAKSDNPAIRDYGPRIFLTNLMWMARGERQCFHFGPDDMQQVSHFMASDPNAQISVISGAWAIALFRSNSNISDLRREAARLQKIEADHLAILRSHATKARVRIWTLAEFVEGPMEPLQRVIDEISPHSPRLTEAPRLADLTGFGSFLQNLRNQGMKTVLMGHFPPGDEADRSKPRRSRPYLVK